MAEPNRLVHVVDEVPELADREGQSLVMVHALHGFLDAGNAARLAARHVREQTEGRVVASFAIDELYDYRARRPPMTFARDHYEGYRPPRLLVRLCHDAEGTAYLLLHGPEPDIRWEAFCEAVHHVIERLGVDLTVGLGAVPMAVPHTRPVMVTNHATSERLLAGDNPWKGEVRVPASAGSLLEVRLGEWGEDAMGFVAHIPHYVAQLDYPSASAVLLDSLLAPAGLRWELSDLRDQGERKLTEISGQVAESTEVVEVVEGLEQQYDAFQRAAEADEGSRLSLAEEQNLPTGEELGAEFERFLAGLDRPDRSDGPDEQD